MVSPFGSALFGMQSELSHWLTPLSFLAGIGLMILSTATRANALDDEIRLV
jgi:hypothetical protein